MGIMGSIVALCALVRPNIAIWLLLLLVPLEVFSFGVGANIRLYQPIVLLAMVSWALKAFTYRSQLACLSALGAMSAWVMSGLPSVVKSPALLDWVQIFLMQVFMLVMVAMVINLIKTWQQSKRYMAIYMQISLVIVLYAIIQLLSIQLMGVNLGLTEWQRVFLSMYARPSGTFEEPNWLAAYLVAPALFWFTILLAPANGKRKEYKFIYIILSLLFTVLIIIASETRSALIGLGFGSVAAIMLNRSGFIKLAKDIGQGMLIVALLSILIYAVRPEFIDRLGLTLENYGEDIGVAARTNAWKYAWDQSLQHPLIGNGLGAWAYYNSMIDPTRLVIGGRIVPNAFLGVFFETGIIGLMFFIIFIISIVIYIKRAIQCLPPDAEECVWLKAFLAGFVGAMVCFVFTNAIRYGFFWLFIALGISMARTVRLEYYKSRMILRSSVSATP
jgi:O-antigen ligase